MKGDKIFDLRGNNRSLLGVDRNRRFRSINVQDERCIYVGRGKAVGFLHSKFT